MNVSATGMPVVCTKARSARLARPRIAPLPARMIGRSAPMMISVASCSSRLPGSGRTGAWPRSGVASSGWPITSSGSSRWVEPGFSDSATLNALRTTSGTISGLETRAFHLVTGRMIPIRSMYWCDSLCIRSRSD